MNNKTYALWLKEESFAKDDTICFEDFFITAISLDGWPIYTNKDFEPLDEEELAPLCLEIDELTVTPGFKAWYEQSGYGYIFLEPSFFDLAPYVVDDGLIYSHVYKFMDSERDLALLITKAAMVFKDESDAFVDWSPHVNSLTVRIFDGGWLHAEDGCCQRYEVFMHSAGPHHLKEILRHVLLACAPGLVTDKDEQNEL